VENSKPDGSQPPFDRLLELARQGSADALGELIDLCRPYLLQVAYDEGDSNLQGKIGDSDVVQYTCLDAVRAFQQFRGGTPQEMRGWMTQILRRRLDRLRNHYDAEKRGTGAEIPLQPDSHDSRHDHLLANVACPGEQAERQEEREVMECALNALPEPERAIIEMRQKLGQPFAEIARILHTTEEAARKRWVRAIQSLQQEVQRRYGLQSG
jgi:RNA polymerase sigma-70 factor (ECF subfamily)